MPPMRRILVLTLLAAIGLAPGAHAADLRTTAIAVDREMDRAGAASGALVVDLESGATVYAARAGAERIPASVNKLNTTAAALLRFGPAATFETTVLASAAPDPAGVVTGDVWLRGGGDPTFGRTATAAVAADLAARGIARITGTVRGDESLFDRLRGPQSTRASVWVGPLSALGFPFPRTADPARTAAGALAAALRAEGVRVSRTAGTGRAPAAAVPLTAWASPSVAELAARANVPSDNYVAEMLLKYLGARFAGAGTTRAGAAVARATLATLGVRARISDGSGLSRANRMSPSQTVGLLRGLAASPVFPAFEASLAVAGRTGTLVERLRRTAAQDACRAKTGSLIGVSTLAGYCTSRTGGRVAFAFFMNGISVPWARLLQDRMVAALARYDG